MTTKQYYECHITMVGKPEEIKPIVESLGWKFSCIDGDIVLGDGVKCYATMHYTIRKSVEEVHHLLGMALLSINLLGINTLRSKIEKVIYDNIQTTC